MVTPVREARDHERGCADRGSASIWVLTGTALVLLAGALSMTITAVGVARTRAAAAADLAALAAAQHLSDGSACTWALAAAHRNAADLSDCRPELTDVTVSVKVPLHLPFLPSQQTAFIRASARAGPTTDAISG